MQEYTNALRSRAKFHHDRLVASPLDENPQILLNFQLPHSVAALPRGIETKLNADAQLQTVPYATVPKAFLYSNEFMAKCRSQILSFKSMTDKNVKNIDFFGSLPAACKVQAPKLGCRGGPYHSCFSKRCSHPAYSFAARRLKIWGKRSP